jgi:riboflavin synthase
MFTGLVQGIGSLRILDPEHVKITCREADSPILKDLEIGDSVAVDGVCLTVEVIDPMGFVAGISPETLNLTTLGHGEGDRWVNLETSLRVGSKLGGHFVTGHVDGLGHLKSAVQMATSWEMMFTTEDPQVSSYVLRKGSVAVNGISLTIAACDPTGSWFTVAVIPHTYQETNLSRLEPGSVVNLEGDILGKYVQKFLAAPTSGGSPGGSPGITSDFLAEHGYL